jgi:hypothetical protein
MLPYEKFDAWKATHELALEVYRITEKWPSSERYQLTSQTRRAALSVPANIASELSYLLRFSRDIGLLNTEAYLVLDQLRHRAGTLTWRLYACMLNPKTPG